MGGVPERQAEETSEDILNTIRVKVSFKEDTEGGAFEFTQTHLDHHKLRGKLGIIAELTDIEDEDLNRIPTNCQDILMDLLKDKTDYHTYGAIDSATWKSLNLYEGYFLTFKIKQVLERKPVK